MIRLGVVLPTFVEDPALALDVARRCEDIGLDGVFCYDHLFPMGEPHRPALAALPMLGAIAARTERITIGTLVSRVTILPPAVLVHGFASLAEIAGAGRLIAAVGTGDSKSLPEQDAYGLPFPSAGERLAVVSEVAVALRATGLTTWIGGRSDAVREAAIAAGAALTLWGASTAGVAEAHHDATVEVTWGGPFSMAGGDDRGWLAALEEAGATWAVFGPPADADWDDVVRRLARARE